MKCKITRRKSKERIKDKNELLKELQELNPKENFSMEGNVISVCTYNLWKVKFPESVEIIHGKNKEEIEHFGFIAIGFKAIPCIYLRGW